MIAAAVRWVALSIQAALPVAGWFQALRIWHDDGPARPKAPLPDAGRAARLAPRLAAGLVDLACAHLIALVHPASWILAAVFLAYRDAFPGGGVSPGKRFFGLEVHGASPGASIARNLSIVVLPIALAALPIEALGIWRDPLRRRISDRIAGTAVVSR